jgi:phage terminase large subunit
MTTIEIEPTTAFFKHHETTKRIVISEGGGRSGKTFSILQLLILYSITNKSKLVSVVAENIPFLKRGAIRDFKTIMTDLGFWIDNNWSKGNSIYEFGNGTQIEFFSADNPGKALGAARDVLFLNEANNMHYEMAFQLIGRTREKIWIDYNPRSEFWAHTEIMGNPDFAGMFDFVHTTFKDNEYLEQTIKDVMLARAAKDENYRRVYVQGLLGNIEGLIFPNFNLVDKMPEGKYFYGLDWGYTNDPTALVQCLIKGDDIYLHELIYQTGLQNSDIVKLMTDAAIGFIAEIVADSAEPKSIDFIYEAGFNIHGAEKGRDSVMFGLDLMRQKNIHITKESINIVAEFRNYTFKMDKNGKILNEPIDSHNHGIDAARYALTRMLAPRKKVSFSYQGGRSNKL